jgi:hypothetical protein
MDKPKLQNLKAIEQECIIFNKEKNKNNIEKKVSEEKLAMVEAFMRGKSKIIY